MTPGELLDPSPEQVLAERLAEVPGDGNARLALAKLLLERGQLEMARNLLEQAGDAGRPLLDAVRLRLEKAPEDAPPRPLRFRWSGVRTIGIDLLLLVAVLLLVFVPGLLTELERRVRVRKAMTRLADPDLATRFEAARLIMRIGNDTYFLEAAASAIEPARLDEAHALEAIDILGEGHTEAVVRALSHPSFRVREKAAETLRSYTGSDLESLVKAARAERPIALILIGAIVRGGRPADLDFILDMARGPDREMRLATLHAISRALEGPTTQISPELGTEATRVIREGSDEERSIVFAGALAVGSDEALAYTLTRLRGRSMLGARAIDAEARKLARYTREQLQNAYSAEGDANARTVLSRALRDRK